MASPLQQQNGQLFATTHQGFELTVPWPAGPVDTAGLTVAIAAFHRRHERLYTFAQEDAPVELVTLSVDGRRLFAAATAGAAAGRQFRRCDRRPPADIVRRGPDRRADLRSRLVGRRATASTARRSPAIGTIAFPIVRLPTEMRVPLLRAISRACPIWAGPVASRVRANWSCRTRPTSSPTVPCRAARRRGGRLHRDQARSHSTS